MANKDMSIREWLQKFESGAWESPDRDVQCDAGWYDWFCKDERLAAKTRKLGRKLKVVSASPKVDLDRHYVFFKNNCPMNGSLYDDFRICDRETGDVVYTVVPRSGHKCMDGAGEVWGRENGFEKALVVGSWKDIKEFFGV